MIMDKLTPTMLALLDYFARLDEGLDPGPYPVRAQHAGRTRAALVERGLLVRARDWRYGAPQLTDEGRAVVLARAEVEALAEHAARRAAARATVPAHYIAQAALYAAEVPDLLGALQGSIEEARRTAVPAATSAYGAPATLAEVERRIAVAERTRDDAQAMGHLDAAARSCDLLDALVEQRRQLATAEARCDGCGAWPGLAHEPTCSAAAA